MTARILVLDDHELLAQSLCYALRARGLAASVLSLAERDTLVRTVVAEPPDVVLLDLQLGEPIGSGISMVRPLTEAGVRVLIVTGVTDRVTIAEALEAGAVGHVSKSEPFELLLNAATRVAAGQEVLDPAKRAALLAELRRHRFADAASREPFERLTPREREVLGALCAGDSVTTIATSSFVSVPTVRSQVRAILLKLAVSSQLEAVALANRHEWCAATAPATRSA